MDSFTNGVFKLKIFYQFYVSVYIFNFKMCEFRCKMIIRNFGLCKLEMILNIRNLTLTILKLILNNKIFLTELMMIQLFLIYL